ncbi:hypothetical protein LR48_Vigan05g093800 [Vigna angularis]|uniref:Uncharacterized protein n=1 Tax=Phaseolus angularis TaxID=3914 RepID=A0A0L9UL96_PHAAN|nr:hypothetical protein LR48_Vigan05g093800 [Vigna angularis]
MGEEEEEEEQEEQQEEEGNVVKGEVVENVDDSEEERMANDDDGFGMENERVEKERRNIDPVLDRWNKMKKKKKTVRSIIQDSEGSFMINEEVGQFEDRVASSTQGPRRSTRGGGTDAGAASTSQGPTRSARGASIGAGAASMREGGRRSSGRLATQVIGSQGSSN